MIKKVNKKLLFILLTFFFSWLFVLIFVLSGLKGNQIAMTVLGVFFMLMPMISVFIIEKGIYKNKLKDTLNLSFKINKWFLFSWLFPPVLGFVTFGVSLLFPDIVYSPEMTGMFKRFEHTLTPEQMESMRQSINVLPFHPILITLIQGLLAGLTINAFFGFGEELGWRGFLLREFNNTNFWTASFIIGLIWGVWHAPLILLGHNYPEHPVAGVFMMILWCILLSPIFSYFTLKAKSVIAASILHGTLNGTAGLSIMLVDGGNDLIIGLTGIAGIITTFIFILLLILLDVIILKDKISFSKVSRLYNIPNENPNTETYIQQ